MRHQRHRHAKRSAKEWSQLDEEVVDDLAVAATFAQAQPSITSVSTKPENGERGATGDDSVTSDENEIEISEEDGDSKDNESETKEIKQNNDSSVKEDTPPTSTAQLDGANREKDIDEQQESSDDDNSEVDLIEALARMNEHSDDEGITSSRRKQSSNHAVTGGPTTENEVDLYQTPVSELESKLQISLTVANEVDSPTSQIKSETQLCPAGHVKCHMVDERTVVVESMGGVSSAPLDEGSLLVVKTDNGRKADKNGVIPLGKVFEVFGPVSRPLYSIRLPPPLSCQSIPNDEGVPKPVQQLNKDSTTNDDTDGNNEGSTPSKNDSEEKPNEQNKQDVSACRPNTVNDDAQTPIEDEWCRSGSSTKILEAVPNIMVYYVQNKAHTIDTAAIMRNSGKGCDASNVFDEEVVSANEVYYSDDEQEREAKGLKKKSGSKKEQHRASNVSHSRPLQHHGGRAQYGSTARYNHVCQPHVMHNTDGTYSQPYATYNVQQPYPSQHAVYPQPYPTQYSHTVQQGYPGYPQPHVPYATQTGGYPPPPPPPPPHRPGYPDVPHPGANPNQQGQPAQESDTVYYDYS